MRIDYLLISPSLLSKVQNIQIGPLRCSDHNWIECKLLLNIEQKQTTWVLSHQIVAAEIERYIQNYFNDNSTDDVSPTIIWDAFKQVFRGFLISKQKQEKREQLVADISKLESL